MKKIFNEIRLDKKNKPDDIVIYNLHLERMDKRHWWLGYSRGNNRISFEIIKKGDYIDVVVQDNQLKTKIIKSIN